ncbi:hypothetical protein KUI_1116 [Taylorella equigenitalis ATCC 35865]|nr:hypothetical protein KUI_1116 [Taylorella equigenitalis ATCC 35865]
MEMELKQKVKDWIEKDLIPDYNEFDEVVDEYFNLSEYIIGPEDDHEDYPVEFRLINLDNELYATFYDKSEKNIYTLGKVENGMDFENLARIEIQDWDGDPIPHLYMYGLFGREQFNEVEDNYDNPVFLFYENDGFINFYRRATNKSLEGWDYLNEINCLEEALEFPSSQEAFEYLEDMGEKIYYNHFVATAKDPINLSRERQSVLTL